MADEKKSTQKPEKKLPKPVVEPPRVRRFISNGTAIWLLIGIAVFSPIFFKGRSGVENIQTQSVYRKQFTAQPDKWTKILLQPKRKFEIQPIGNSVWIKLSDGRRFKITPDGKFFKKVKKKLKEVPDPGTIPGFVLHLRADKKETKVWLVVWKKDSDANVVVASF